jgi:hypothetical protein
MIADEESTRLRQLSCPESREECLETGTVADVLQMLDDCHTGLSRLACEAPPYAGGRSLDDRIGDAFVANLGNRSLQGGIEVIFRCHATPSK